MATHTARNKQVEKRCILADSTCCTIKYKYIEYTLKSTTCTVASVRAVQRSDPSKQDHHSCQEGKQLCGSVLGRCLPGGSVLGRCLPAHPSFKHMTQAATHARTCTHTTRTCTLTRSRIGHWPIMHAHTQLDRPPADHARSHAAG